MAHRPLGKTGLLVSPIAFGAFKIGRNEKIKYSHPYPLPTDAEVDRLLNIVLDLGINLIDTAPAYGTSELRIGQHLSHRRREFLLSTKVGETFEDGQSHYDFSAPAITASLHRSLQRLRTDAVDLLFIHSDGRDLAILNETDIVPTLQKLKQGGLSRFIGLSGKTVEGAHAALPWADVLMVEYHPNDTSHSPLIAEAAANGIGILIKKPLASGAIPPEQAIPFLLSNPSISSLVIGGLNPKHMARNVELAEALNLLPTLPPRIFLRIFVEVPNANAAAAVAERVRSSVSACCPIRKQNVQQYWKIPEYFGIDFDFEPPGDVNTTFQNLMATLATGWKVRWLGEPDQWAVWNPAQNANFILPEVRWANLGCYRETRLQSGYPESTPNDRSP
jgi:aryl-alcohol dehydrogenase-like predicted oxidoreductase